jgi:4-diphosphocytidyl-2-C-methyl-D-erythritol kinase
MMRETAYAKVNLALHVRGRDPDGYHRLETIFAFAEDGDLLEVSEPRAAGAIELELGGPFGALLEGQADNLVLKAATHCARPLAQLKARAFRLDKRLPVASGIGGGSADAAAGTSAARPLVVASR